MRLDGSRLLRLFITQPPRLVRRLGFAIAMVGVLVGFRLALRYAEPVSGESVVEQGLPGPRKYLVFPEGMCGTAMNEMAMECRRDPEMPSCHWHDGTVPQPARRVDYVVRKREKMEREAALAAAREAGLFYVPPEEPPALHPAVLEQRQLDAHIGVDPHVLAFFPGGGIPLAATPIATSVRVTVTSVDPWYPREIVRRYVKRKLPDIEDCYDEALARDRSLAGTVEATWSIRYEGDVSAVTARGVHRTVDRCIAKVIASMRFPRSHVRVPIGVTASVELSSP